MQNCPICYNDTTLIATTKCCKQNVCLQCVLFIEKKDKVIPCCFCRKPIDSVDILQEQLHLINPKSTYDITHKCFFCNQYYVNKDETIHHKAFYNLPLRQHHCVADGNSDFCFCGMNCMLSTYKEELWVKMAINNIKALIRNKYILCDKSGLKVSNNFEIIGRYFKQDNDPTFRIHYHENGMVNVF